MSFVFLCSTLLPVLGLGTYHGTTMANASILRVFAVPPARTGIAKKTGNAYSITEAQCATLDDTGAVVGVGVLNVPSSLVDKIKPGDWMCSYAVRPTREGKIEATITDLTPVPADYFKRAAPAGAK